MSVRRRGNGLTAESYVLLLDVDPRLADALLAALAKAGVAAYTTPTTSRSGPLLEMHPPTRPLEAVHVDSTRRPDARRVLESTMPDVTVGLPSVEEEDQFAALVAGWDDEPDDHPWPAAEDVAPTRWPASPPSDPSEGPPRRRRTDVQPGPQDLAPKRPSPTDPTLPTIPSSGDPRPSGPSLDKQRAADSASSDAAPRTPAVPDTAKAAGKADDHAAQDHDTDGHDTDRHDADDHDPAAHDPADHDPADHDLADHYVPPHLPPLPPSHPVTKWGLVALGLGLVLLIFPMLLGLEHTEAVNIAGVFCILGGVGLLVSRLGGRSTHDYEGPDDGAIV